MNIALGRDLAAIKAELMQSIDAEAEEQRMALADRLPTQATDQWPAPLAQIDVERLAAKRRVARATTVADARAAISLSRRDPSAT